MWKLDQYVMNILIIDQIEQTRHASVWWQAPGSILWGRGGGGLECWLGLATLAGFESRWGNVASAIPFTPLCQCLSEDALKAVDQSLLSGVLYARGSKLSHRSTLECVTVVESTTHSKLPHGIDTISNNSCGHTSLHGPGITGIWHHFLQTVPTRLLSSLVG